MSLTPSSGGPIGCAEWDALVDVDGFLALGRNRYTCQYVIYTDGTYFYAEDGTTGQLDYGGPTNEGGVSGTDAGAVIQAAINAITVGGVITIKSGTYRGQIDLTNRENITIRGEGTDYEANRGTVIIAPNNLDDHLIKIDGTTVYGRRVDIVIEKLTLNGNSANQASGNLIDIHDAYGVKIRNCELRDPKDYAIYGRGTAGAAEQITIESNFIRGGGIYVHAGNTWYILNNEITTAVATKDGITIYSGNSHNNTISENTIYLSRKGIYVYHDVEYQAIVNNKIWENVGSGIDVNDNCSQIVISGNHILSNDTGNGGSSGIDIRNDVGTGCDNIIIVDNVFDDYQGVATQTYHIHSVDDADDILIENNYFGTFQTGAISLVGINNVVCTNLGYNPVAASTPAVGASPVTFGPYWYPIYVEVVGNVTGLTVRGQATSIAFGAGFEGSYMLYPGDTIVITYPAAAPTVTLWPQ